MAASQFAAGGLLHSFGAFMFITRSRLILSGLALCFGVSLSQAAVVVVVSAKSDVANLSTDQVAQIFMSKTSTFPSGEAATPVDQDEDAPARDEFYDKVAGKDATQMKAYWSQQLFRGKVKLPLHAKDNDAVKKLVAEKVGFIGYIDKNAVDPTLKVVFTP